MPSKSKSQHNLMEGVAHNPAFAKKVGIPEQVGKEFAKADKLKGVKFKTPKPAPMLGKLKNPIV